MIDGINFVPHRFRDAKGGSRMSIKLIIFLMLLAGLFGGLVNYALTRPERFSAVELFWAVVLGVGASFLVPLFLNTISSQLLSDVLNAQSLTADVFVYFGFCLIGAIASKAMIRSLTQKALDLAEKASSDVKKLEMEVEPIVLKETEPSESAPSVPGFRAEGYALVGDDAPKVIMSLGNSRYSRRTVSGIAHEAGVSTDRAKETLAWLADNSLAFTTEGKGRTYWSLSEKGLQAFETIVHEGMA